MNLKYVEPTGHDYPKELDDVIPATKEYGTSYCCTFNRRGTLLAIGCREGRINIWDFETRSIATVLYSHKSIVTSVSWSRNGTKLLSSDYSGLLLLWDIYKQIILIKLEFSIPIEHSWLHGRKSKLAMIHLNQCQPLIITFEMINNNNNNSNIIIKETKINHDKQIIMTNYNASKYKVEAKAIKLSHFTNIDQKLSFSSPTSYSKKKKKNNKPRITCAVFDKYGQHIYCGTSSGRLFIVNYSTWKMICSDKITNGQQIKSIVFSRCGKYIVVNCGDRIIRYIEISVSGSGNSSYFVRKNYQDAVERKQWSACCFSSNSEYICAASAQRASCVIMIWQRCFERSLEKVLKGPDSNVIDMIWHPIQPLLISITMCGEIQIWNENYNETGTNWSTFANDFEVIDKNVWYRNKDRIKYIKCITTSTSASTTDHDSDPDDDINEEEWLKNELNKSSNIDPEDQIIDIFGHDSSIHDFFSDDEDVNDLLDINCDKLCDELVNLPIKIISIYNQNEIKNYLNNIQKYYINYNKNIKNQNQKKNNKNIINPFRSNTNNNNNNVSLIGQKRSLQSANILNVNNNNNINEPPLKKLKPNLR